MSVRFDWLSVPLSKLVPDKKNPRRVKPEREAHRRLVASIRAHGLLLPLVVRKASEPAKYIVIAGNRKLAALREIHRNDGDPKILCVRRKVEEKAAEALALAENFAREAMHPQDEAEAFARLARDDGKEAESIAADFGVPERYVRQRMKLAALAEVVKEAYREGAIDTATAEAFAAVPEERQMEVWQEMNGHPRHAEHVRNIIAHGWIDATHAIFDLSTLPPAAVSRDLFSQRVLVERSAFMKAQAAAVDTKRHALAEEGWAEVVAGQREDVQDRLWAMDQAEPEYDAATTRKLATIDKRWEKIEAGIGTIPEGNEGRIQQLQQRLESLEAEAERIRAEAPIRFAEETKAVGTAFLILDPDGRVRTEYRVARQRRDHSGNGDGAAVEAGTKPMVPTSDDLSDRQLAVTFTQQALAVREALLDDAGARKRVLALILHDKGRSEALAIRHEANGTTLHATMSEGFSSPAWDRLKAKRTKLDPFGNKHHMEDTDAYAALGDLSKSKLDALIDLLIVETLTAHLQRKTELVHLLANELKVDIRHCWRPDAAWLGSYTKLQLAHLTVELRGPTYAPAPDKKKSELVEALAKLFTDAAEGRLEDKKLAERVNRWRPVNLREEVV